MKSHNDAGVSIIDDEDIKSSPLLHAVRTYSDSDDAVAFYRGSTRYEDAEEGFVHIWADLPDDVHERAQVMYDGSLNGLIQTEV
jgi:hypothetical protein